MDDDGLQLTMTRRSLVSEKISVSTSVYVTPCLRQSSTLASSWAHILLFCLLNATPLNGSSLALCSSGGESLNFSQSGHLVNLVSACLTCTAACHNWQSLYAQRFFLGALESGVSPGFMLIVGGWFTKQEQALRMGAWCK